MLIGLLALYIGLLQPYMQREYVRLSDAPVTIEAEYFTVTGDPLCTKLYRVIDSKITNNGVFPNMPQDIPDPHNLAELKDGDRLALTGFLYEWHETNLITGTTSQRAINMMDVIGYQALNINYQTKLTDITPGAFRHENYTNCRP